jgi:hypothetical protein
MADSGSITGWGLPPDAVCGYKGIFAVGDGNHSLASAKALWDEEKVKPHPNEALRYALVEIENIYDIGIEFKPIHRLVFDTNLREIESRLKSIDGLSFSSASSNVLRLDYQKNEIVTTVLEPALSGLKLDYIHGDDELIAAATKNKGSVGLLLPPINKHGFFTTIEKSGPMPRKSFSMGEASEKRFYLECRRLS